MRLLPILLTASLLATTTLALPQLHDVRFEPMLDVDALLTQASNPQHPTQGPVLTLAHAHGLTLTPLEPLPPRDLTLSLLDAYVSLGHDLTPELIQSIELSAQELPIELHAYLTPILDALTHANNLGVRLQVGEDVSADQLMRAALQITAATEQLALANAHEPLPWPEDGWADEFLGLRIGTPYADEYKEFYFITIDPVGHDTYYSNAGATGDPILARAALAIDLQGNDTYTYCTDASCYDGPRAGSATNGIGILIDAEGNDTYDTSNNGHISTSTADGGGVAVLVDLGDGDDNITGNGDYTLAWSYGGSLALYYNEAGDDEYDVGQNGLADAGLASTSLFIDNAGTDNYTLSDRSIYAKTPGCLGRPIFIDNGSAPDNYPAYVLNNDMWQVTRICQNPAGPSHSLGTDR